MKCTIMLRLSDIKKSIPAFFIALATVITAFAQDTITYHISFPDAVHHEAQISLEVGGLSTNTLTAIMSKSSPGRYSEHNFAKNVYNIKAFGSDSTVLPITRTAPNKWQVTGIENTLYLSYTLYANYPSGTYSGIDRDFANINMPSALMWLEGMESLPVKVVFHLTDTSNWKIATQLITLDSAKHQYFAPDLQYLMDSPCILGDFSVKEFYAGHDKHVKIRMAVNSEATPQELEQFAEMTSKVIREQEAVFGELPQFKNNQYTFLCSYGPSFQGDGMEHRNSSMISSPLPLSGNLNRLIGTVSHEFFHVWNIERIRPKSLEPFDFTRANMSGELWFGEGRQMAGA